MTEAQGVTTVPAAPVNPDPEVVRLSNGATLLNVPMPYDDNVGIYIIVRGGTRSETEEQLGLQHVLEHMFFKGSTTRPSTKAITSAFRRLGGDTNAYTGTEDVCYYVQGPKENVLGLAQVLCDMFCHPLFDAAELRKERKVVIEELATRAANNGMWLMDNAGTAAFGPNQPLGFPSDVEARNVAGADRRRVLDCHAGIAPENVALVVCGGAGITKDQAEEMLKDMPQGTPHAIPPAVWGQGPEYVWKSRPALGGEIEQSAFRVMLPGFSASDKDAAAADVLASLLGGGIGSRLFIKIRERRGLVYTIRAGSENLNDAGIFTIAALCGPDKAEEVVRRSFGELRAIARHGVPQDELDEVKASMAGGLKLEAGNAPDRGLIYAQRWSAGLPLETPVEMADTLQKVTAADVQRVAKLLVSRIPQVRLAVVSPRDQGRELLAAARGRSVVAPLPAAGATGGALRRSGAPVRSTEPAAPATPEEGIEGLAA